MPLVKDSSVAPIGPTTLKQTRIGVLDSTSTSSCRLMGKRLSHPVMFNPDFDEDEQQLVLDALLALNDETYLEDGIVGDLL